jgi:DNA-binding transcriptional MerR regulator
VFTVKRAAELTGVSPATLRAWEQRYGLAAPARTGAGYRLYDDAAVGRIRAMKAMVDAGWAPREAAARLEEDGLRAAVAGSSAESRDGPEGPHDPGGPDGRGSPDEDLVAAALDMDGPALERGLDRAFGAGPLETVLDDWLMPFLQMVGERWADGRVGVATEHLLSAAVQRRLATALADAPDPRPHAPRVVVGLPRGSRHELGALACAAVLRRRGVAVAYAGADLPASAWVDAMDRHGATVALLAVPTPDDVVAARDTVDVLASDPRHRVFVGGAAAGRLDRPSALRLDGPPAASARHLLEVLGTTAAS